MKKNMIVASTISIIMAVFVLGYIQIVPVSARPGMDITIPNVPPVKAYSEGKVIYFIHSEASDEGIAEILSEMMNSPVLVTPSLGLAPSKMLANVYVFTNGIPGDGPLGFQLDVFDNPPPSEAYRPLRRLNKVAWANKQSARILKFSDEVLKAAESGELKLHKTNVVINMPMLTWPSGHR